MFFPEEYNLTDPTSYYISKETLAIENKELKRELAFYKSIMDMNTSCIFNLSIKYRAGKKVWFDRVRCERSFLLSLDMDEELLEMLANPPRPSK